MGIKTGLTLVGLSAVALPPQCTTKVGSAKADPIPLRLSVQFSLLVGPRALTLVGPGQYNPP